MQIGFGKALALVVVDGGMCIVLCESQETGLSPDVVLQLLHRLEDHAGKGCKNLLVVGSFERNRLRWLRYLARMPP